MTTTTAAATATATATEPPVEDRAIGPEAARSPDGRWGWARGWFSSIRTRFVALYVALIVLDIVASFLVGRQLLLNDLDKRVDARLEREVGALRRLAGGNDPATGEPFGANVRRVFRVYLQNTVGPRDGMVLTLVGGVPFLRTASDVPYRLDRDRELVARWGRLRVTDRGRVGTPAGAVDFVAVPVRAEGQPRGVFVVAVFRNQAKTDLETALTAGGAIDLTVLLLGALLAWLLAGRVLRPLKLLTQTARSITESDLTHRIPVEGDDEVAQLATTFNDMISRLERAFMAQRRFVDDAGHELKTPITIIGGHLEVMGDDPVERKETLALVKDELERMGRIVNDLLLLAKAEHPDFLKLETVDTEALTHDLHEKAAALAPREWRLEATGHGRIVADNQRLTQAFLQLAQNAVAHTDEGDVIGLGSAVSDGEARFWVRDQGPGIAHEEQERIFERFSRGSARRHEGAGLGLSIVRAIAEAHHGRIELYSRPGAGATFSLVIPADQPQPGAKAPR